MARSLEILKSVPDDHAALVTGWQLINNVNLDPIVVERSFFAEQSIVVIVRNAGAFSKVSVSNGVDEASEHLVFGQALIVRTTGVGNRAKAHYRIKVKAENKTLNSKGTYSGQPLFVSVTVRTFAALPPSPRPHQPPAHPVPPYAPGTVHIVKRGESLSKIAKLYYGDENKWKTIYDANRNTIGNNPNLIFPGQRLTMP